jgi:hypothetical protein
MLAMKRAVEALNMQFDQVLVDGNCCPNLTLGLQKSLKFLKLKEQNCVVK